MLEVLLMRKKERLNFPLTQNEKDMLSLYSVGRFKYLVEVNQLFKRYVAPLFFN